MIGCTWATPSGGCAAPATKPFIESFVSAVRDTFPGAVLQWEDFKQHNAIRLLDAYRYTLPSFNDDIQGTAVVVLAGILAAMRALGTRLRDQRLVLAGSGAAGTGIARLVGQAMRADGASPEDVRARIVLTDSRGLVFADRAPLDADKRWCALPADALARYGFTAAPHYDLETVIRQVAPTILIGTTGTPGTFTAAVIREMAARTPVPIVFPLSNPTSHAEAVPADILAWSDGRALVATGSPFDPVEAGGRTRVIAQANNLYTFPGLGLGTIAARARAVTDPMLLAAASTLAALVPGSRLDEGALYPALAGLRQISRAIAIAVAREAQQAGLARIGSRTGRRGGGGRHDLDAGVPAAGRSGRPGDLAEPEVRPAIAGPGRGPGRSAGPPGRRPGPRCRRSSRPSAYR